MKTLKALLAASLLTIALARSVAAGDMNTPYEPPPPPPPSAPQSSTSQQDADATDTNSDPTLAALASILIQLLLP